MIHTCLIDCTLSGGETSVLKEMFELKSVKDLSKSGPIVYI